MGGFTENRMLRAWLWKSVTYQKIPRSDGASGGTMSLITRAHSKSDLFRRVKAYYQASR